MGVLADRLVKYSKDGRITFADAMHLVVNLCDKLGITIVRGDMPNERPY